MPDVLTERTMTVTPAMRAKIEELVELVIGALPGYKISDVTFSVTMTAAEVQNPAEKLIFMALVILAAAGCYLSILADRQRTAALELRVTNLESRYRLAQDEINALRQASRGH